MFSSSVSAGIILQIQERSYSTVPAHYATSETQWWTICDFLPTVFLFREYRRNCQVIALPIALAMHCVNSLQSTAVCAIPSYHNKCNIISHKRLYFEWTEEILLWRECLKVFWANNGFATCTWSQEKSCPGNQIPPLPKWSKCFFFFKFKVHVQLRLTTWAIASYSGNRISGLHTIERTRMYQDCTKKNEKKKKKIQVFCRSTHSTAFPNISY